MSPTVFPAIVDTFVNPNPSDSLGSATVPHANQHANANDSIRAIEIEMVAMRGRYNIFLATQYV